MKLFLRRLILICLMGFLTVCGSKKEEDDLALTVSPDPSTGPFSSEIKVTISSNLENTDIYYTTDGKEPTESSKVYSEAVAISSTTTLKAFAKHTQKGESGILTIGKTPDKELVSEVKSFAFTFVTATPTPTPTPTPTASGEIELPETTPTPSSSATPTPTPTPTTTATPTATAAPTSSATATATSVPTPTLSCTNATQKIQPGASPASTITCTSTNATSLAVSGCSSAFSIDSNTGVVSGTMGTSACSATVTASNSAGSATDTLNFTVLGALTYSSKISDGANSVDGIAFPASIAISSDGAHVYVAGYGDDAIALFTRNSTTGALTYVSMVQDGVSGVDGLDGVKKIVLSPTGNHLYAVGYMDSAITVFSRNSSTGALTFVETQKDDVNSGSLTKMKWPYAVAISADGNHVYTASFGEDSVNVFSRNSSTGALTFVESHTDGASSVNGLDGASDIEVTADGKSVYVTGYVDKAVVHFSRNTTSGALTYQTAYIDGTASASLDGARALAISSDGAHVYVAAQVDDAVVHFTRNTTTGALTEYSSKLDTNYDGLDGANGVALSADGKNIYATALLEHKVSMFGRNTTSGNITYGEVHTDDTGSVQGLSSPTPVLVSPDGKHVYVGAGTSDHGIAVFTRAQ